MSLLPPTKIPSGATISVKAIDLCDLEGIPCSYLHTPPIKGVDQLPPAPSLSFLLEHESGRKLLFDLGVPKDLSSLGPKVCNDIQTNGFKIRVEQDVSDYLEHHGLDLHDIEAVIWSHSHWDHKGNISLFPPSTDLIVGPLTSTTFISGEGNSVLGGVNPSDTKGRNVREVDFTSASHIEIGRFPALDYFGDGSLYILNSPGHEVGHICGLARTTSNPDTFVLLGGDVAHHCAEYRPSSTSRVPEGLAFGRDPNSKVNARSWLEQTNLSRGRESTQSLFDPLWGNDLKQAHESIGRVQDIDTDKNVLVLIAHDVSVRKCGIPFFPEPLNDWKKLGLKEPLMWSWIGDVLEALEQARVAEHS